MRRPGTDTVAPERPSVPGQATTSPTPPDARVSARGRVLLDEPTRDVCSAVADGSVRPARLAIIAPGGYGKSAVLDHLAGLCDRHGVPVARYEPGRRDTGDADAAAASRPEADPPALLLVDDAHDLGAADLDAVFRAAEDERSSLVIAARPWPRPPALNAVLARLRGQIVLRPLDQARIATLLGPSRAGLADFVLAQTHGIPGLVDRLITALDSDAGSSATPASQPAGSAPALPASAAAQLRGELDHLPAEIREFLLATASGAGLDTDLLAGLLGTDHDGVARIIETARAGGLLGQDGTPPPLVRRALETLIPHQRWLAVSQRLVRLQLDRKGPVLDLVRPLLDSGLSGEEPAEAFVTAADEAAADEPALAARLYRAASDAGRTVDTLGARWAEAAARAGDLDTALRLADQVIAVPEASDRADGARTAATALVHRGQLGRAAELYRWSGTGVSPVYAALALLGTGHLDAARELLDRPDTGGPPTLSTSAMSGLARGVLESVAGSPTAALSTLADAAEALEPVGRALFVPDTPAAVGALVGIHSGELGIARTLLERALAAGAGGPACAARHTLLLAWIDMIRGETDRAAQGLASVGTDLAPRDWLFAVGLRAGLARRTSDLAALRAIWSDACAAVIRHRVDVFTLLPFGEFAVAAARLGDRERLTHHLRQAGELLHALGDPPLWSVTLHWSGLHAAIMADQRAEAAEHVRALAADAEHSRYHAALADAAGCWLDVLGGTVDPARVEAAAKALNAMGLCWDAARLAGQAAIRTTDRTAMVSLLECARALQGGQATASPARAPAEADAPALSDRERQVAELVVAGMTYRQVGDRLFISAKTVEHHMARMRQRLGATSRSDLLTQLRALVSDGG